MTDSDNGCPRALDMQDFIFKEESVRQLCEGFQSIPLGSSLIAVDGKRGLLYIGHESKLTVLKPGPGSNPEWKLELELPHKTCRVEFNCDYTYLAITFNQPVAIIYDASSISTHKLDKLYEIRLSSSGGNISVLDLKWNPAMPDILCSITSDHIIGCFQVSKDKGVHVIGSEKPGNLEALCVSWSPKGKQLVVGCKNGDIVQLKPELKIARHLTGPNPSQGIVISILWISNYQFCACYLQTSEETVNVMIIDAPKGVTNPKFTNYEDITFGGGSLNGLCYYFEYVTEWGLIVVASSHSSELAVLGTSDNGTTWNLWQLAEGGAIQLPLNRKQKTENYPVGIAIDKTTTEKLPWGTDNTLANPVPILRILVTSGQLCCYHMINLKANALAICSPPTETIPASSLPRPSLGPSEVSFNLPSEATSTPQKQLISQAQPDRSKVTTNMFGDSSASTTFSFGELGNKFTPDLAAQIQMKNVNFSTAPMEPKMSGLFGQEEGKSNLFQQPSSANKQQPTFAAQPAQPPQPAKPAVPSIQVTNVQLLPSVQPQSRTQPQSIPKQSGEFSATQVSAKTDFKIPSVPAVTQSEPKSTKELPKEQPQSRGDESKSISKQTPVYDEGICLQAFREEKTRFEAELKSKLQLPSWSCGTEEERQRLVKKTFEIEEFFKELQDTTSGLAVDIAYLKALLLQSFAWLEESKSKTSTSSSITGRSRSENTKLTELQHLYYYTQAQLIQAIKVLDSKWADHKSHELSKMKIPSTEMIYQSLLKHSQIIAQEKKTMEELTKKWRSIARGRNNNVNGMANLDRSMASLNLSQSSNTTFNDTALDLRCKLIATNTRNFSKEKQARLRDLLAVTEPKIIPTAKPTEVQDRLQTTLSSLASAKSTKLHSKPKTSGNSVEDQQTSKYQNSNAISSPIDVTKTKSLENILSSLDSLVSGLGGTGMPNTPSKSPSSTMPFATTSVKPMFGGPKQKTNSTSISASPVVQQLAGTTKTFSFTNPSKAQESQISKDNLSKTSTSETALPKVPTFSFAKQFNDQTIFTGATDTATSNVATPKFSFSTTAPSTNFGSLQKADNASIFKFPMKTSSTPTQPAATPSQESSAASPFSFGNTSLTQNQQQSPIMISGQVINQPSPTSTTPATPARTAAGLMGQLSFNKTPLSMPIDSLLNSPDKPATKSPSTPVTVPYNLSNPGCSSTIGSVTITALPNLSAALDQTSPTTTSTTTLATQAQAATTTTASSTSSFAGLLGATASLSFGSTPSSTVSTGIPTFGNIFGSSTTISKVESSTASTTSSSTTSTSSATSIFGDANKTGTSLFGGQTTVSTSNSNTSFSTKVATTSTATTASGTSVFGTIAVASTSSNTSIFDGSSSTAIPAFTSSTATPTSNVFGTKVTTQSSTSIFGGSNNTTTTKLSNASSVFGINTSQSTTGSLFGACATPSTASSLFGTTGTPSTGSVFGICTTQSGSSFGCSSTASGTKVFGAAATTTSPAFGVTTAATTTTTAAAAPSSIFGTASASSPFSAATTSMFNVSATPTNSIFGASTTASTPFGSSAVPSTASTVFGSSSAVGAATTQSSLFGNALAASSAPTMFGTPTATTTASNSMFGAASPVPTGGSVFGATTTSPASGGSVFGGPPAMGGGTSMFGASSPGSAFGQPAAFGSKPVFGASSPAFGTGFGAPPAFGAAPSSGFGVSPSFGAAPPAASTSPGKVFGSSTFEALGAQSEGLSFGSLAQKTPEPKPQAFQGSSSFSSWR